MHVVVFSRGMHVPYSLALLYNAGILDAKAHSGPEHTSSGTIKNPLRSSTKSFHLVFMSF